MLSDNGQPLDAPYSYFVLALRYDHHPPAHQRQISLRAPDGLEEFPNLPVIHLKVDSFHLNQY